MGYSEQWCFTYIERQSAGRQIGGTPGHVRSRASNWGTIIMPGHARKDIVREGVRADHAWLSFCL